MSRTNPITPARQAIEDRALAYLQSLEGFPARPGQIAEAIGPVATARPCRCKYCGHDHMGVGPPRVLWNSDLNSLLKRLERKGLVERLEVERGHMNPTGAHWWRAT
jgi:hypothetical protein